MSTDPRVIFTRRAIRTIMLDPGQRRKSQRRTSPLALSRNFPQHQQAFDKNLKAYLAELDTLDRSLGKNGGALCAASNMWNTIPEWIYFADRYGYETDRECGTKARNRTNAESYSLSLVQKIKQEKAQLLIYGAQNPRLPAADLSETGIKALRLQ